MALDTLTLDHVGIVVPDLDRAFETYRRLGFQLTARSSHKKQTASDGPFEPLGSGNHCIMFRQGYLELLGITDPAKPHAAVAKRLDRYTGLQLIALGCDDADAVERAWRAVTDGCEPAVTLGRDVPLAEGGTEHGAFRIVYLDDTAVPEVELFAIQHLTPDVLWQPALLDHPAVIKAAKAHSSSPACVLLRWALQKGWAVIPKSSSKARIAANVAVAFELSSDEMAALDALDLGGMKGRLCWRRDELRDLEFE